MDPKDLTLISDYLAGDLTPEEALVVEDRIRTEPDFASLIEGRQQEIDVLRASQRAELKEVLREQMESVKKQQGVTRNLWTAVSVAAAAAVMLLIWFAPWRGEGLTSEQLAMGYLEPYPLTSERGPVSPRQTAFDLYRQGKFAQAIPLLDSLNSAGSADPLVAMYLAESLSHTGDYAASVPIFRQLAVSSPFRDAAQWRLALNLILAGEVEKASETLKNIDKGHYKHKEAETLRKAM